MKIIQKYAPFFMMIVFITLFFSTEEKLTKEWIELVLLFIIIILLFEIIETSRSIRTKKWINRPPAKLGHVLKFSIFLGLPLSIAIIYIFHEKTDIFYGILFIVIPLLFVFGWIGLLDWKCCDKKTLEDKYKVELK